MLHKRAKNREKGNIGEDIACKFLCAGGFTIVDRNYQKKWGELDIVAKVAGQKGNSLHFFEVKSITRDFSVGLLYKPEDNVNDLKVRHLRKIIQTYLAEKNGYDSSNADTDFHFHILCVYMNEKTQRARVHWIKNVIL